VGGTSCIEEATNLRRDTPARNLTPSPSAEAGAGDVNALRRTEPASREPLALGEAAALPYPREWVQAEPVRTHYVPSVEAEVIAGCIAGDNAAWETLISRYQNRVFNVTYHMTQDHERAADLAQEAFIQILKSLSNFRGEASLSTWIHGLTMRVCLHHMRRERRRQMESWEDAVVGRAEPETNEGRPHETISREQLQSTVRAAVSDLPLKFRSVMVLHGLAGMTYEETAEALNLPLNTVKTRVHRAKAKLKTRLQGALGEEGNGL
jgi:RNA polymerase sigma-70 factor, ECF subfamily